MSSLPEPLTSAAGALAMLTALSEASFDSVLLTNTANEIVFANSAFRALTGYTPEEVVGKSPRILQGPATDARVIERLTAALKEGGSFEGSAINYRKDSTAFIMHWRVVPVRVAGVVAYWMAIQREGSTTH